MRYLKLPAAAGALAVLLASAAAGPSLAQNWEDQGGTGGAAGHAPNASDPIGGAAPSDDSYGAPEPTNAPPPMDSDPAAAAPPIAPPPIPDKDPDRKE